MKTKTTDTPRTDSIISAIDMDAAFQDLCRQLERELTEKTNEIAEVSTPSDKSMLTAQSDSVELYHALCDRSDDFSKALDACRDYRKQLDEKTNEVARLRELMRDYIDFIDENMGATADWPMEAAFDDETTAQRHCDLLNAMKREVKPEDIN